MHVLLNSAQALGMLALMKKHLTYLGLAAALSLASSPLHAACYADYKAKMDDPLRLHYGVVELPDEGCDPSLAFDIIAPRVAEQGWQLLEVMSLFDETGLETRRADAGQYFLSF